ncbi:MAG: PEGA domain-containing protein, partial [Deltaproteobacteria bacterium]|nr:PEGA domain-containing protein [Deltaproteobacteria bacterium]
MSALLCEYRANYSRAGIPACHNVYERKWLFDEVITMKCRKIILITLLILLTMAQSGAKPPDKRLKVVVYVLEAQGIEKSTAEIMTTMIVSELSQSKKLLVRDEKTTMAILKEKGLAQTDHCDEEVCRIDTAKLIKADRIVLGSIGKLKSGLYLINVRVADVNGTTIYPQNQRCRKCTEDQLLDIIEAMARNIRTYLETGKKPRPPKPLHVGESAAPTPEPTPVPSPTPTPVPTPSRSTGKLVVRTTPTGARIFIDAEEVGVSNKTVRVAAGEHEVVL